LLHGSPPFVIPCRTVIETIKDVDGDRKCFRMIGGVLVERSVKEVLPALRKNREQVSVVDMADTSYYVWYRLSV